MMPQARQMAGARGVIVNGLAILGEQGVDAWYRRNVIVGPGSFVMVAKDYEDFAEAMRRKLLREITHDPRLSELSGAPLPEAGKEAPMRSRLAASSQTR